MAPLGTLFAVPDFRRLWLAGAVVFAVRWLEMLVVGVFVYQQTGSAFLVALMTLLRLLPMALFGVVVGALAERLERRTGLMLLILVMMASSGAVAVLAWLGQLAVWHLAVASFANGVAWAADNPVRRVMIGEVVGPTETGRAMSLDIGANNASRMLGPTAGGALLTLWGTEGAFLVSVVLYGLALVAASRLGYRNRPRATAAPGMLAGIAEGLALVRRDPRLIGTLVVTVIFNVFGWPFTSMIPVLGQDVLQLTPQGIGLLASMDGVGSLLGAALLTVLARPALYRRLYVGGVLIYLLMLPVVALSVLPAVTGAALVAAGLASAGFSIMQSTLVYLAAPPDMRSRMYGVLSVCIGLGPLGFVHLGLLADWIGAPQAVLVSGLEGLLALALTRPLWRRIASGAAATGAIGPPAPRAS